MDEELSLAVEHDMLLREECSIVFTLIKRRPTLLLPKPLVAGTSRSPHGALALSSARELFLQLRDTLSKIPLPCSYESMGAEVLHDKRAQ